MKKILGQNGKTFIFIAVIITLISLAASFPNSFIQAIDATITRNLIWSNSGSRTAATADSIMGFIDGSDTATMIPLPGAGAGYWSRSGGNLSPLTTTDNVILTDSVYMSGLPTATKDTILYWDNDTVFKGLVPSGGSSYWDRTQGHIYPSTITDSVGVGTSNPIAPLDVSGDVFFDGDAIITGQTNIEGDLLLEGLTDKTRDSVLYISNDTVYKGAFSGGGGASVWEVLANQRATLVSPNTSAEADTLSADYFTDKSTGAQYLNDNGVTMQIGAGFPIILQIGSGLNNYKMTTSHDHSWRAGNVEYMYWDNSDDELFLGYNKSLAKIKVGGTAAPTFNLHIDGDVGITDLPLLDSDTTLVMSNDSIGYAIGGGGGIQIDNNTNNLVITATGKEDTIQGETEMSFTAGKLNIDAGMTNPAAIGIGKYSTTDEDASQLLLRKHNGSNTTTWSAITSGDYLGSVDYGGAYGSTASDVGIGVSLLSVATENYSSGNYGSSFSIMTAKNGESSPSDRMIIDGNGDVEVTGDLSAAMLRQTESWDAFGGFQDSTVVLDITEDAYSQITNSGNDLWGGVHANGITMTNDTMTFTNAGTYTGSVSITFEGSAANIYEFRVYNVTDSGAEGFSVAMNGDGVGDYRTITKPLFFYNVSAGDEFVMQVTNLDSNNDITLKYGSFFIHYLHD